MANLTLFSLTPGKKGRYLNGDLDGNPVGGTGFYIDCKGQWNNTERVFPGPCYFRPTRQGTYFELIQLGL